MLVREVVIARRLPSSEKEISPLQFAITQKIFPSKF